MIGIGGMMVAVAADVMVANAGDPMRVRLGITSDQGEASRDFAMLGFDLRAAQCVRSCKYATG